MLFYPSKNHNVLNRKPFHPDQVTGMAMLNPHYRSVSVVKGTKVIEDSGAFQERDMLNRLTPAAALDRQLAHRDLIAKKSCWLGFNFDAIVTYDMLVGVDEVIIGGKRIKRRGSEETAKKAVQETISSAVYYNNQRDRIGCPIAFSCQGATPEQYARCAGDLIAMMYPSDVFAFGGFCILGMQRSLLPTFATTLRLVFPLLSSAGVRRAHLLGVCWWPAVQLFASHCHSHGIIGSTDSSAIEVNSIMGKVWKDGKWMKVYSKQDKGINYHCADLALENIERFTRTIGELI